MNPVSTIFPCSVEAKLAVAKDHELVAKEWAEPHDLVEETIISYPVDRDRLDLFTSFLDPAGVEPIRSACRTHNYDCAISR